MTYSQLKKLKEFLESREEIDGIRVGDRVRMRADASHTFCYTPSNLCEDVSLIELDGEFRLEGSLCRIPLGFLDKDKSFEFVRNSVFLINVNGFSFNLKTRTYHFTPILKLNERGGCHVTPFVNGYRAVIRGKIDGRPPLSLLKNIHSLSNGGEIDKDILSLDEYMHIVGITEGIEPDPISYDGFTLQFEKEK